MADAVGWTGLRATKVSEVDDVITRMIETEGPVIVDMQVEKSENCFPMIPSGKAHNDMLLGEADTQGVIQAGGAVLV